MSGRWQVKAFDNFGAPGEGDVFDLGVCESREQAIAWAQHHVRKSLEDNARLSISIADLISRYQGFGEETVVFNLDDHRAADFSARDYAHAIAREVFQDWNRTEVDPALRAAYRDTDYVAALPEGETLIRIGERNAAIDTWLRQGGAHSAVFFSASNPMSQPLSPEVNAIRHAELLAMVKNGTFPFVEALGCSPDGEWSETSLLIAGVPLGEANRWARVFDQAGYVWIDRDKPASLRIRTLRDTWVEEADLD